MHSAIAADLFLVQRDIVLHIGDIEEEAGEAWWKLVT